MGSKSTKRLFFGLEAVSRWPEKWPTGSLLNEEDRHMTLSFLGDIPFEPLEAHLDDLPEPPFKVGPVGYFDKSLLLPPNRPRLVAWQVRPLDETLFVYQHALVEDLRAQGYSIEERPFLPHVTLARSPFVAKDWEEIFRPRPCFFPSLNLYESLGDRRYRPIWSRPFVPPFVEIESTSDMAFLVRGESMTQLQKNAFVALSWQCPAILAHTENIAAQNTLEDWNAYLQGLKAVSFCGDIEETDGVLERKMILSV